MGKTPTPAKTCDDCGEYEQDCGCGGVKVRARLAEAEADAREARRQLGFANLYLSPACPEVIRKGLLAFLAAGDPDA